MIPYQIYKKKENNKKKNQRNLIPPEVSSSVLVDSNEGEVNEIPDK